MKLEELKQGDVISNGSVERKVLGVCGVVVMVSSYDDFEEYYCTTTFNKLNEADYQKKSFKPKKGDRVLASDSGKGWAKRYFSHMDGDKYVCFADGKDEWTNDGDFTTWINCEPA